MVNTIFTISFTKKNSICIIHQYSDFGLLKRFYFYIFYKLNKIIILTFV